METDVQRILNTVQLECNQNSHVWLRMDAEYFTSVHTEVVDTNSTKPKIKPSYNVK